MRHAHDVATVRTAEAALMAQLPPGALMQRAATGLAATSARLLGRVYGTTVVLLVGAGDNGGDALFAGAALARRGGRVFAVPLGSKTHPAGLAALCAAGGRTVTGADADAALASADLVLDGIVGIGGRGALRQDAARAVGMVSPDALVVAVDVPSGVDADTGCVVGPAVRAHATVTFGTYKPGLLVDPGAARAGAVELVDIGLGSLLSTPSVTVLQDADVAQLLPRPAVETDKYRRGVVGIVAGSTAYTGAPVLAVGGALRTGVGMVRFVSTASPTELVRARWPEAVVTVLPESGDGVLDAGRVQAWVVGPGIGTDEAAKSLVAQVLSADVPVVVDADGLTILAQHREFLTGRRAPTVLTPHAGELARLLHLPAAARADIEARRLHYVRAAAAELGATVLLKGSTTLVCSPVGLTRVNPTGTSWLATAGSGDVLSGIVGAFLSTGMSPVDAASCGAYVHGMAARRAAAYPSIHAGAQGPIAAGDVAVAIPEALAGLSASGRRMR